MRRTAPLLLCVLLPGCAALLSALHGALIGGATGALATGNPAGIAVGALAGLVVGGWDGAVAVVTSWFGGGLGNPPPPSHTIEYILIGLAAYFVYKFVFDYEFRTHLLAGLKRTAIPTPKRKPND